MKMAPPGEPAGRGTVHTDLTSVSIPRSYKVVGENWVLRVPLTSSMHMHTGTPALPQLFTLHALAWGLPSGAKATLCLVMWVLIGPAVGSLCQSTSLLSKLLWAGQQKTRCVGQVPLILALREQRHSEASLWGCSTWSTQLVANQLELYSKILSLKKGTKIFE